MFFQEINKEVAHWKMATGSCVTLPPRSRVWPYLCVGGRVAHDPVTCRARQLCGRHNNKASGQGRRWPGSLGSGKSSSTFPSHCATKATPSRRLVQGGRVGSQKTLAGFLWGVRGFGLFLDRAFVWCVLGFGCFVWLYGVLRGPTWRE